MLVGWVPTPVVRLFRDARIHISTAVSFGGSCLMCQHIASTAGQDPRKRQFGLHSSGGKEGVRAPPSAPPLRRRAGQHPHRCQLLRVAFGARSRGCQHVGQCCAGRHHSRDGPVGRASTQGDWLTRQYRQDDDFVACLACMPLHIRHPTQFRPGPRLYCLFATSPVAAWLGSNPQSC